MGSTTKERLSEAVGRDASDVESDLIDLAVEGLVTHVSGGFGGWLVTDAGKAADAERSAVEVDRSGARPALSQAYQKFIVLNPELLDLCTAWQMRTVDGTATANDHSDAAYDSRVLTRLADLHGRAARVCADLAAALPRFERYHPRLDRALGKARAGELDYVADNLSSYHSVWFQLHEDLLVTLGIPRH
jgi:hypothetical protein